MSWHDALGYALALLISGMYVFVWLRLSAAIFEAWKNRK